MRRYAHGHDPLDFVEYDGDEFNYVKTVYSPAAQELLMAALLTHWRDNGRDVSLCERFAEEMPDG